MFGTMRFLLACGVLVQHAAVPSVFGFHPGVASVVVFYIISGYVMTGLMDRHYGSLDRLMAFYADRLMRIYPQYLFIVVLTIAGIAAGVLSAPAGHMSIDAGEVIANLLIVPLNYFMYVPEWSVAYVPPAWSLGAELQFYLLFPFLLLLGLRPLFLILSLVVFTLASFDVIPTNTHSYRLLSGVLFMFLLGSFVFEFNHDERRPRKILVAVYAYIVGLFAFLLITDRVDASTGSPAIFIGVIVGLPAFAYLSRLPRRAWDERIGDLSYGVFLSHYVIIWFLDQWEFFHITRESHENFYVVVGYRLLRLAIVAVGATALAYIGFRYVEKPIIALRKRLRKPAAAA